MNEFTQDYDWKLSQGHIMPVGDTYSHKETISCWCKPVDNGEVIVHNAIDGRVVYNNTQFGKM